MKFLMSTTYHFTPVPLHYLSTYQSINQSIVGSPAPGVCPHRRGNGGVQEGLLRGHTALGGRGGAQHECSVGEGQSEAHTGEEKLASQSPPGTHEIERVGG